MMDQEWQDALNATDPGESHRAIVDKGRGLAQAYGSTRLDRADAALILYHGSSRYSFRDAGDLSFIDDALKPVAYNLIQAVVDTKTNSIFRNKVRPMFVTENGDADLKEKAKGMGRVVESVFHSTGIWGSLGYQVCLHGQLFEAGGVKVFPDYESQRVSVSQVFAHECHVDPLEAQRGNPRRMWHIQPVAREELLARFADDEGAVKLIRDARPYDTRTTSSDTVADLVEVIEYWHLPSRRVVDGEEHDGVHVLAIDEGALLSEPWPYDRFPIAWFRPLRTAVGYWSTGIPERLAQMQVKVNELNDRIDRIIKAHAVPRMVVNRRAKVNVQKITNDVAGIVEVDGSPMQAITVLTPQSVPAELMNRTGDIIALSEKQSGFSEMSISAQKPAGVNHAPGMQHLADMESIRHTAAFREWETFHTDLALCIIDAVRMLAEQDGSLELLFSDSKQLRRIKWKSVDLDDSQWHLRVWPTNLLPQTPAAKLSTAMELYSGQVITREQLTMALDFPDIEAISGDQTAALDNIERLIADARAGKQAFPSPYMNLELCRVTVVNEINRAEADGEDEETVDRLRDLWLATDEMIKRAQMEAAKLSAAAQGASAPAPQPGAPVQ